MSQPISVCRIVRAANGSEKAYERLKSDMRYNRTQFAFTLFPCEHDPRCEAPEEKRREVTDRINGELDEEHRAYLEKHPPNPQPFSKFVFPVIKNMPEMPPLEKIFVPDPHAQD